MENKMLIVFTSENLIPNESHYINLLFKNGLEILHLRKPGFSIQDYRDLLREINPIYYQQIVIHEYHELCVEFLLKGMHLKEAKRQDLGSKLHDYVFQIQKQYTAKVARNYVGKEKRLPIGSLIISSAFHSIKHIEDCDYNFSYYVLSPVFNSISKKGYSGKAFNVSGDNKTIVALGGVCVENMDSLKGLGYKGAAVLGAVWNSENPLTQFLVLQKEWETTNKPSEIALNGK